MPDQSVLDQATHGNVEVCDDWMRATGIRPLVFEDPVLVWLEYHGAQHGFTPDTSPYEFTEFIFQKGRQFEEMWVQKVCPYAVRVCSEAFDVRAQEKLHQTRELIQQRVPVISQPALWWAPERIYGVPDVIALTSWVREKFPELVVENEPDHYLVLDIKFTTNLDRSDKKLDLANYASQVRLYSYMLGQLQGSMPGLSFLVTRDRLSDPLPVSVEEAIGQPLPEDLAALRDRYLDIKLNGGDYLPWRDEIVAPNLANTKDDPWHAAKVLIARDRIPGGDPCLVYQVGQRAKDDLAQRGFPTLQSLLDAEPDDVPLEDCYRLKGKTASRIRAILAANRSGRIVRPANQYIPTRKTHEFYVDLEYFTNVNVDFDAQWPTLDGCEIIFMIGVGWERDGQWGFESFVATEEDRTRELEMFERFLDFLAERTGNTYTKSEETALYHWSSAEKSWLGRACDRHDLADDHPLRKLPWVDLETDTFLSAPVGIPGAWVYKLKEVAKALGTHEADYRVDWPGDLAEGLRAMVMGWRAYQAEEPLDTPEMRTLTEYLETDCKALWAILRWLRAGA